MTYLRKRQVSKREGRALSSLHTLDLVDHRIYHLLLLLLLLGRLPCGESVNYGVNGLFFWVFEAFVSLYEGTLAVAFYLVCFIGFVDVLVDADDVAISVDFLFLLEKTVAVEDFYL